MPVDWIDEDYDGRQPQRLLVCLPHYRPAFLKWQVRVRVKVRVVQERVPGTNSHIGDMGWDIQLQSV